MSTPQPNGTVADQNEDEEPELVELHFELEMDYQHGTSYIGTIFANAVIIVHCKKIAFEPEQVITGCIAAVMGIRSDLVFFDGAEDISNTRPEKDDYAALFKGHIPTTKHEIEDLVQFSMSTVD